MPTDTQELRWTRKHLLGLQDLSSDEIRFILDTAKGFAEVSTRSVKKVPALRGRVVREHRVNVRLKEKDGADEIVVEPKT